MKKTPFFLNTLYLDRHQDVRKGTQRQDVKIETPVLADFDAGGSKLLAGRVPLAAVGGWHLLLAR